MFNNIKKRKTDFIRLKDSLKSIHPEYNTLTLYYQTMRIIFIKCLQSLLQSLFGIKKKNEGDKNTYILSYYHNFNKYLIPIKVHRGYSKISEYKFYACESDYNMNSDNVDITEEMSKFLGPNYDFHGLKLTPCDLGYKNIRIDKDRESVVFTEFDSITL